MIADVAFWRAYAVRHNIVARNPVTAAARAFSESRCVRAVIVWPNGKETIFDNGLRFA
jgi:hypothetical protein